MIHKLTEALKLWAYNRLLKADETHEWFAHVRQAADNSHHMALKANEYSVTAKSQAKEANARSAELGKMITALNNHLNGLTNAVKHVAAQMDLYQERMDKLAQRVDELEAWQIKDAEED